MSQLTRLSTTATPGGLYGSFSGKASASGHAGEFTRLSVIGVPGSRYGSFGGKTPAGPGGHTGLFTRLGVTATPSLRYGDFSGKTPTVPVAARRGGGSDILREWQIRDRKTRDEILREDDEIIEIVVALIQEGVIWPRH